MNFHWQTSRLAWVLFGSIWMLYLLADTFVTRHVRVPIPAVAALAAVAMIRPPDRAPVRASQLFPRWSWGLFAVYLLAGIREPLANATYLFVLLSCIAVFRYLVGSDARRYVSICRLFCLMLIVSSLVLFVSQFAPILGLGIRVLVLGDGVLLRPYPSGLSLFVHTYGYQAAALGGICVAFIHCARTARPGDGSRLTLVLLYTAAVLLFSMQRSAVLSTVAAACIAGLVLGVRPYLRVVAIVAVLGLVLSAYPGSQRAIERSVIGKDRSDTVKGARLELQTETLTIIKDHPWGLILEGRDWDHSLFRWGGALSQKGLSAHNAYLMIIAYLGVPAVFLLGAILIPTLRIAVCLLRTPPNGPSGMWPSAMALVLVATLCNALLHNSSIFTAEGSTIFSFVAVRHWADLHDGERTSDVGA